MSGSIWNVVIALVLILHGIGHGLGMLAVANVKISKTHSPHSWLLDKFLGNAASRVIGFIIWLLALVGFVGAGLGMLGWLVPPDVWPSLAIGASLISLLGLFLFWDAFPFLFPNKIGVIVVDVAVLVWLWF